MLKHNSKTLRLGVSLWVQCAKRETTMAQLAWFALLLLYYFCEAYLRENSTNNNVNNVNQFNSLLRTYYRRDLYFFRTKNYFDWKTYSEIKVSNWMWFMDSFIVFLFLCHLTKLYISWFVMTFIWVRNKSLFWNHRPQKAEKIIHWMEYMLVAYLSTIYMCVCTVEWKFRW